MDTVIGGRDDAEVFARAKRVGCAGVEIIVGGTICGSRMDVSEARRAKQATGLEIHALVLGEHNEKGGR